MDSSDETIFARAQRGERQAFGLLVHRYQDRAYSLALNVLHHPQDAQDAVQQTFLRAWQKRGDYSDKWPFRAWFFRILTNVCTDEYRRRRRRVFVPADTLESIPASDSPERNNEGMERSRTPNRALEKLPAEARVVLALCYMKGLSYGEIARIRGVSVNTVKSRLCRAKELLRPYLDKSAR
jgi:RNA polymerase sigma-70 factor (ECF subfamily)